MTSLKASITFERANNLTALKGDKGNTLVVGLALNDGKVRATKAASGAKEMDAAFKVLHRLGDAAGAAGRVSVLQEHSEAFAQLPNYTNLVALGLGASSDYHAQNLLHWGGRLGRSLRDRGISSADIWLDSLLNVASSAGGKDAPKDFAGRPLRCALPNLEESLEKFAVGLYLGLYTFTDFRTVDKDALAKVKPLRIRFVSRTLDKAKGTKILNNAQILAESVYFTRDLENTPSSHLKPADLARKAQEAGRIAGFNVTVWDEKKIKAEGMGGVIAVGQGSDNPPRFIIMEYGSKKKGPTVVMVGKGVIFDTGGISLKPGPGMEEMKYDMSGSAAVIGAMMALAKSKAPVHAVALVPAVENSPSGKAINPGDIYTALNGRTVEVLNTDAEGRLILSDALVYANTFNPHCVIDVATLTGACVIALGYAATGMMGNNGKLLEAFTSASAKAGERVWEMPLYKDYHDDLLSRTSDYKNIGSARVAGTSVGGAFLNFFVEGKYPWIHLDVAGTAHEPKGQGDHCPPDFHGTGVPVRALVEFTANVKTYFKG